MNKNPKKYRIVLFELGTLNLSISPEFGPAQNSEFLPNTHRSYHLEDSEEVAYFMKKYRLRVAGDNLIVRGQDVYGKVEAIPELKLINSEEAS